MNPVQEKLQRLVDEAKIVHTNERENLIRSIQIIARLDHFNAQVNLRHTDASFAAAIGLSYDAYKKRVPVARMVIRFPEFVTLLRQGETAMSTLGVVANKITEANAKLIFEGIRGKSRRKVEAFLSRVTCDGQLKEDEGRIEVKMIFTESEWAEIERAREVLSASGKVPRNGEIFLAAVREFLKHKDKVEKAKRAQARAEKKGEDVIEMASKVEVPARNESGKRTAVPAVIRHARSLIDNGQCSWIYDDGSRCQERLCIELDHRVPVGKGGTHRLDTTGSLCKRHNLVAAEREFGREVMQVYVPRLRPIEQCAGAPAIESVT